MEQVNPIDKISSDENEDGKQANQTLNQTNHNNGQLASIQEAPKQVNKSINSS